MHSVACHDKKRFGSGNSHTGRRIPPRWRLLLLALAIPALIGATTHLGWPLGQDQGILLWVGETIRQGGLPYHDAWDVKGPLAYVPFALLRMVPLPSPLSLRLFDFLALTAGVTAVGVLARRTGGASILAGTLLLFWFLDLDYDDSAQPEAWVAFVVALALAGFFRGSGPRRKDLALFGACVAGAILVKPTFLVLGAVVVLAIAWRAATGAEPLRALTTMGASGLLVLVLTLGWLGAGGGLSDMADVLLRYTAEVYAGSASILERVSAFLGHVIQSPQLVAILAGSVVGIVCLWQTNRWHAGLFLAWGGGAIVALVVQGKFFPYHFASLYPPAAVLSAIALSITWRNRNRVGIAVCGVLIFLSTAGPAYRLSREGVTTTTGWLRGEREWTPETATRAFSFYRNGGPLDRIAERVQRESKPEETIQMWGQSAGLYILSGRRPPTRFGMSQPLVAGARSGFRQRYREEFLRIVGGRPPRYVVARSPSSCAKHPDDLWCLSSFPSLARMVATRYTLQTTVDEFALYRREGD
jgi:hypothetical protein